MRMWLEGNRRYCDRDTAIELGGSEYENTDIHTILHFDEYITIVDEVCHGDTLVDSILDKAEEQFRVNPEAIIMGNSGSGAAWRDRSIISLGKGVCHGDTLHEKEEN